MWYFYVESTGYFTQSLKELTGYLVYLVNFLTGFIVLSWFDKNLCSRYGCSNQCTQLQVTFAVSRYGRVTC